MEQQIGTSNSMFKVVTNSAYLGLSSKPRFLRNINTIPLNESSANQTGIKKKRKKKKKNGQKKKKNDNQKQ